MNIGDINSISGHHGSQFSLRELLAMVFRHKRAASWTFFGIVGGTILAAIFMPTEYTSTAKFLIGREVMDPVVSPE